MIVPLNKRRYDLYTLGTKQSILKNIVKEISCWSDLNEQLIGALSIDLYDEDYGWTILVRDKLGRFIGVHQNHSIKSRLRAEVQLKSKLIEIALDPSFNRNLDQENISERSIKLLEPLQGVEKDKFHPYFLATLEIPGRLPTRKVISEISPWLYSFDKNFIRDFQCHQFDQRLWEIYLWAAFREMCLDVEHLEAPDFKCAVPSLEINFTVEATTVSPSTSGALKEYPNPETINETVEFLESYMPIKFGSALTTKLNKVNSLNEAYWERKHSEGQPFIIAIADFHKPPNDKNNPSPPINTTTALCSYLYGQNFEGWDENGLRNIKPVPIKEFSFGNKTIPSNFFGLPKSENVSGVLFTNAGTISKFDRMGAIAGFGAEDHKYFRVGFNYPNSPDDLLNRQFVVDVKDSKYEENWCDELHLFHNPNAKFPIPPEWLPDITHQFFKDGEFYSINNDSRIMTSMTWIFNGTENVPD